LDGFSIEGSIHAAEIASLDLDALALAMISGLTMPPAVIKQATALLGWS
jgi:hypothetical protein